jgi:hypothetical protein
VKDFSCAVKKQNDRERVKLLKTSNCHMKEISFTFNVSLSATHGSLPGEKTKKNKEFT